MNIAIWFVNILMCGLLDPLLVAVHRSDLIPPIPAVSGEISEGTLPKAVAILAKVIDNQNDTNNRALLPMIYVFYDL